MGEGEIDMKKAAQRLSYLAAEQKLAHRLSGSDRRRAKGRETRAVREAADVGVESRAILK
jgi:hypothetical protein